jgi:hypothetical protein
MELLHFLSHLLSHIGTTNPQNSPGFSLGDKIKSLIEPALTNLGTKIPGWGWAIEAFASVKESSGARRN